MKRFYGLLLVSAFVLVSVFAFSSCSYSELDSALNEKVHNNQESIAEQNQQLIGSGVVYIREGEMFSDYFALSDLSLEDGIKGLNFTFNKATVYDTIYDSPISTDECRHGFEFSTENLNNGIAENAFVLVDMTAHYEKTEETQPDKIQFLMCLDVIYKAGEGFKEFQPSTFQNGGATNDFSSINPTILYFSEQPKEGDKDLNENEIDLIHQSNKCRTPLENGKSLDFQIGILVPKELIEDKNLFLINRFEEVPEGADTPIYYVDLLGRFQNEGNAEN